ncbi:transposase [Streptomyces goshikiensis]|uniref:DDE-type integrase/transposase/recombinase n=1 Tax=Streptomyces goshikiensis TaxID=1942 RepID=UPI0019C8A027|nr:DDE-type integrase/transposase/recombinase [Streptomyces goshikiensis]GHD67435.1 hypothetical protein GCM10010336_30540 [Streptomyces goshikiensis]
MTEIVTGGGKLCLVKVIDLFSRRLLGYAMGAHRVADLVAAAPHMAAATRGGDVRGVIFHSDRGSEFTSRRFRRACRKLGVAQSMGRVGSCFGNAVSEAFTSVLKVESVHRRTFTTRPEGPDQERDLGHRLLQRKTATQRVRLEEPDRLRTRLPGRPRRGTGCTGRSPRNEGIDT